MEEEVVSFKREEDVFNIGGKIPPIKIRNPLRKKRIQLTLHPEEIQKINRIRKERNYSISGMIGILIREYKEE